jgi:hypothetical protein
VSQCAERSPRQRGVDAGATRPEAELGSLGPFSGSTADFVDLHLYPFVGDLTLAQLVENFGYGAFPLKPVVMGEFGARQSDYPTVQQGAQVLRDWQIGSCEFDFKGWLLWTWDTEEQQNTFPHWAATSADSSVQGILAPITRPSPCQ